ncbi:uncharacterized protein [Acropora muricata]|uniref:uncharacterized protein n=1 Tax=Acropora muricata TaxID=159855 RepID=UPI0034E41022
MADGNNIDMHSDNQNEDRLLMSDNENRLQQLERPESPPRNEEDRNRRIRRMNREQRDMRERARDRRRHNRDEQQQRHHHSPNRHRQRPINRNADRQDRERVGRHQDAPGVLQRSK